mmetsp:Transcript_21254/g.52651  ORF Transcript_21254/g.52651 Transcript_21254/m.52651 type:complete len:372 (+) Transcript_21254:145-1260(+)|eukprot:CAMPEP_0116107758 /NCGR_PEP_ID=MMETSP0327-20121206/16400_1 /TAXON_ID=44447 /ORGANISM="Pseudo-nitzschia delicatissima, Strain B596" /LENGTH=371 /DNA_ID=CAMNT_0003600579 /DNA_START=270 /DNA_END=1385 /DNA_ORIENTATION=-
MSSGVQAAHSSIQFHALHSHNSPHYHHQQEPHKMSPNSEDHLVNILRQPPIVPSRQISRDSDLSVSEDIQAKKDLTPPQAASVITPRENTQGYSVISSSYDTLSSLSSASAKMPILSDDTIVRREASTTIVANEPSLNKRKSPDSSPPSRRDSLPLGLRNKKMKATDCLLFAATLLEQETSQPMVSPPIAAVQRTIMKPKKTKKPLKKMFCEKVERSMQEAKKKKQEELEQQQQQQELQEPEDYDNVNKPKDADVLCGRGGKVNKHPGNIVYRKVVEYNKSYYQSVHKKHRILVSQSIVRAILNYGGRFMGQKGKEWIPICFKRAVQKTSQALRERSNTSDGASPLTVPPSGASPFPDTLHFKPQQLISKD